MPISDIFPNIPGYVAQINDFGLVVPPPQQSLSQSVLLLGVATDGPVNTPVSVSSIQDAETLFGAITANPTASGQSIISKSLTRGLYEAFQAGCTDVRLCRVGGTSSTLTLVSAGTASNNVILTALYPGVKYNAMTAAYTPAGTATPGTLTIVTTDAVSHALSVPVGATFADLMGIVNLSGLNIVAAQAWNGNPAATVDVASLSATAFSGGTDGTNVSDTAYSNNLAAGYKALEDYAVNIVVPLGAYLQPSFAIDSSGNPTIATTNGGDTVFYGQNLAQFLARMSQRESSAFGIISVAPLSSPTFTVVNQRAAALAKTVYTFQYQADYAVAGVGPAAVVNGTDGNPVNLGRFLNICAGPDMIVNNTRLGNYYADSAASYAGRVCSLAPQSSTTNKPIANVLGLTYAYGLSAKNTLAGQGFTIFEQRNGTTRTVADNTYAPNGLTNPAGAKASDFQKLSTVRITYAAIEAVRSVTQQYIGEANTPASINAMANDVNGALKVLQQTNALLDYQFQLLASSADQINGNMTIRLILTPALEIRKIIIDVRLAPPGSVSLSSAASAGS